MKLESGDIVVLRVLDKVHKSKVSKVDGNVIKLFEEDGSYRQMSTKILDEMVENGFAFIEKYNQDEQV